MECLSLLKHYEPADPADCSLDPENISYRYVIIIPAFNFRKKGILISYQSRSVVCLCVCHVSCKYIPSHPLDLATLYLDRSHDVDGTGQHFMSSLTISDSMTTSQMF